MGRMLVLVLVFTACTVDQLRPPAAPPPAPPPVGLVGQPAPGLGRIVLDTPEGPALVERVSGGDMAVSGFVRASASLTVSTRLCVTPCVVDLPPGPYELRFTLEGDDEHTSTGFVNVSPGTTLYRHALGRQRSHVLKTIVGWTLLTLGAMFMVGAAQKPEPEMPDRRGGFLILGGLSGGLGLWMVLGSHGTDQPGAGAMYPLDNR